MGSFFPAWMFCALIGVAVAIVVRQVLVVAGLEASVPVAPLTHGGVALAATLGAWLLWFGH